MNDSVTSVFPSVRQPMLSGTVSRVRQWLRESYCGINGHTLYRDTTDPTVLRERCTCGYTTTGIPIGGRHYQRTYAGDTARHRLPKI